MGRHDPCRLATLLVVGTLSCLLAIFRALPAPEGDLEAALAEISGLVPRPGSVREAGAQARADIGRATRSRAILFLASNKPQEPADLYLADARTAPGDRLLRLSSPVNLTESRDGDDCRLEVLFPFAAVATRVGDRFTALTIFHLDGQRSPRGDGWSPFQVFLSHLTAVIQTGRWPGIGRVDLRFPDPARDVDLRFSRSGDRVDLVVDWHDGDGHSRQTALNPRTGETARAELELLADRRLPKRPVLWLVDTVRSLSWIGPGPIEWAEGRFFAMQDRLRRLRYDIVGDREEELAPSPSASALSRRDYEVSPGIELGRAEPPVPWPPPPIVTPVFKAQRKTEGTWRPDVPDFVAAVFERLLPEAPVPIYRTWVRTDRDRPYVRVELIAVDTRQLELHMVAGLEDPRSTTGARGTGRIPRDADLLQRVVLAFNGAFKTEHGAYGMMVDGTVLLPPQDGAATVATVDGGWMAMGSWPDGAPIPEGMVCLRQNMDPLVEDGVVNPRKRYLWGFTLDEDITNMNTIRSGICMTEAGTLIYAWGEDLTARTLGIGMNAAGCVYGMHLDMNPYHTALIQYAFPEDVDLERPVFDSRTAIDKMRYSPNRYVHGAPKDFFFMTVRRDGPGPGWSREGLAQPAPAFLGAVFLKREGNVELVALDARRTALEPWGGADDDLLLAEVHLGPLDEALDDKADEGVLDPGGPVSITGRKLISGAEVRPSLPEGDVVAVGRGPGHWLLAGRGPADELAGVLVDAGVADAVCRPAPAEDPWLTVRREGAMTDFAGAPRKEAVSPALGLRVMARPAHLGGRRLEVPASGDR